MNTIAKLFSRSKNIFGNRPNANINITDIAHPGTLPILNKKIIKLAIKLAIALKCKIKKISFFSRKHYNYPDLPKGYQITQSNIPFCENGILKIYKKNAIKNIIIKRIHIEEDAAKNIHNRNKNCSYIDFNRAGIPLLEIVTNSKIKNKLEAMETVKELKKITKYLNISNGNMQEGAIRTYVNINEKSRRNQKIQ